MKGFRESINPANWRRRKERMSPDVEGRDAASWDRIPTKIKMDDPLSVDTRTTYADSPVPPDVIVKDKDLLKTSDQVEEEEERLYNASVLNKDSGKKAQDRKGKGGSGKEAK